jgi:beta-glucosidase
VVQCYVGHPGRAVEQPVKLLRGFDRVDLAPGETRIVRFVVSLDSLRYRDVATHGWVLEPGGYRIMVGGSSASLLSASVTI